MTNHEAIEKLVNAEYTEKWQGDEELTLALHMAVEALSSAEPKNGRRIPCSERLPEQTGRYIVWLDSGIVDIAEFYTYADFVQKEIANNYWNKASKVLYWMPLPESTKTPEIRARDDDYAEF